MLKLIKDFVANLRVVKFNMKRYAAICNNKKVKYLYENDLVSKNSIISLLKDMKNNRAIIFENSVDFILKKHGKKLEKYAIEAGYNNDEAFDIEYYFENYTFDSKVKITVWDKKDIINNIVGNVITKYNLDTEILLWDGKIEFNEQIFRDLMMATLNNIDNINKSEAGWILILKRLHLFVDYDLSINTYNYNLADICKYLYEENKNLESRINYVISLLNDYIEDRNKSLHERRVPDDIKERIVSYLYDKEQVNDKDKKTFIKFMNDLADKNNPYGLWVKCYSYYGGNKFVPENYKISEECLLKLIDVDYNDNYADTLGYIYYYGRVNNGIPEYDKAYKYFSLAAFSGNVEARYKIGDMYKNGYYLEKNITIAKTIYDSLYREVMQEFYHDPKRASLADVSLRIASFYEDDKEYMIGYRLYLQALLAINIRNGSFDSSVRRKIIRSIKELYEKYREKINCVKLDEVLDSLYGYKMSFKNDILCLKFNDDVFVYDYKNMYAEYSNEINIQIKGRIIKNIKKDIYVDSVERNENIYLFLDDYGKLVAKIKIDDYEIIQTHNFISNKDDNEIYKVAVCQYEKELGKKYHFLYEGNPDINKPWFIKETNQQVYPIEFIELNGYELACDVNRMKTIK